MSKKLNFDICFQCGKPRVQTKAYKEFINGSLVTTVENVCSDPVCQKRTIDVLNKEKARRDESMASKLNFSRKPQSSN